MPKVSGFLRHHFYKSSVGPRPDTCWIMRTALVILAIFIVGLSFIPCSEEIPSAGFLDGLELVKKKMPVSNSDFCTPFCSCHCCSGLAIDTKASMHNESYLLVLRSLNLLDYLPKMRPTGLRLIWEPPKI